MKNKRFNFRIIVLVVVGLSAVFCICALFMKSQIIDIDQNASDGYDAAAGNYRQNEFLKLKESHNFDLETCDIVHLFSSDLSSSFIIKKGRNSGIELNDPVITDSGEFVGQVTKLGNSWAIVSTVWKADALVDSYICENDILGMITGEKKLEREKLAKFISLEDSIEIFVGDEVLTSGLDGIIPADLVIGTITYVHVSSSGKIDYSLVKPACYHDGKQYEQVYVIKNFE